MDSIFPYSHLNNYAKYSKASTKMRRISDFLPKLQNVLDVNFFVKFALQVENLEDMRQGINDRFIAENIGLLCHNAVLLAVH